jgi:hypothetical protein
VIRQGTFHLDLSIIGAEPLGDEDPRQIGAIAIKAVLGSGGMERVYLGVAAQGYTAVKRVPPYLSNDHGFPRAFGQELDSSATATGNLAMADRDSSAGKQLWYDGGAV